MTTTFAKGGIKNGNNREIAETIIREHFALEPNQYWASTWTTDSFWVSDASDERIAEFRKDPKSEQPWVNLFELPNGNIAMYVCDYFDVFESLGRNSTRQALQKHLGFGNVTVAHAAS